jgi:hypothetical protein
MAAGGRGGRPAAAGRCAMPWSRVTLLVLSCAPICAAAAASTAAHQQPAAAAGEHVAAQWPADPFSPGFSLGNHRAEVAVPATARSQPAVLVNVIWRRRSQPNATTIVAARPVTAQYANASMLRNVAVLQATMHKATIVFDPEDAAHVHLYFLPYHFSGGSGGYSSRFGAAIPSDIQPDPKWLSTYNRTTALPWANVTIMSARTKFDAFTAMERAASPSEVATALTSHQQPFLLVTEKRTNSIRMNDALPIGWLSRTNRTTVTDTVQPGEFYTFQVGVHALPGHDVTVDSFSASPSSVATLINCFSLAGTRFNGTQFTQVMRVNSSRVGVLWFGVDAGGAHDTWLNATVHINLSVAGVHYERNISLSLAVEGRVPISGKGDRDPWRLSRLRWLDSTEGRDHNVSKSFVPITVVADQQEHFIVELLDRSISVNRATGLPTSIVVRESEILASPMQLLATATDGTNVPCVAKRSATPIHLGEGTVVWSSQCTVGSLLLTIRVTASYEGFLDVLATVSNAGSSSSVSLTDLKLVVVRFLVLACVVSPHWLYELTYCWMHRD